MDSEASPSERDVLIKDDFHLHSRPPTATDGLIVVDPIPDQLIDPILLGMRTYVKADPSGSNEKSTVALVQVTDMIPDGPTNWNHLLGSSIDDFIPERDMPWYNHDKYYEIDGPSTQCFPDESHDKQIVLNSVFQTQYAIVEISRSLQHKKDINTAIQAYQEEHGVIDLLSPFNLISHESILVRFLCRPGRELAAIKYLRLYTNKDMVTQIFLLPWTPGWIYCTLPSTEELEDQEFNLIIDYIPAITAYHTIIDQDQWKEYLVPPVSSGEEHDLTTLTLPIHLDQGDWVVITHGLYRGDYGFVASINRSYIYEVASILVVPRLSSQTDGQRPPPHVHFVGPRSKEESIVFDFRTQQKILMPFGLHLVDIAVDNLIPTGTVPQELAIPILNCSTHKILPTSHITTPIHLFQRGEYVQCPHLGSSVQGFIIGPGEPSPKGTKYQIMSNGTPVEAFWWTIKRNIRVGDTCEVVSGSLYGKEGVVVSLGDGDTWIELGIIKTNMTYKFANHTFLRVINISDTKKMAEKPGESEWIEHSLLNTSSFSRKSVPWQGLNVFISKPRKLPASTDPLTRYRLKGLYGNVEDVQPTADISMFPSRIKILVALEASNLSQKSEWFDFFDLSIDNGSNIQVWLDELHPLNRGQRTVYAFREPRLRPKIGGPFRRLVVHPERDTTPNAPDATDPFDLETTTPPPDMDADSKEEISVNDQVVYQQVTSTTSSNVPLVSSHFGFGHSTYTTTLSLPKAANWVIPWIPPPKAGEETPNSIEFLRTAQFQHLPIDVYVKNNTRRRSKTVKPVTGHVYKSSTTDRFLFNFTYGNGNQRREESIQLDSVEGIAYPNSKCTRKLLRVIDPKCYLFGQAFRRICMDDSRGGDGFMFIANTDAMNDQSSDEICGNAVIYSVLSSQLCEVSQDAPTQKRMNDRCDILREFWKKMRNRKRPVVLIPPP